MSTQLYVLANISEIYAIAYIAYLSELAYMQDRENIMAQIARTPKQLGDALRHYRTHTRAYPGNTGDDFVAPRQL